MNGPSRRTLLLVASIIALCVGGLFSYFLLTAPPKLDARILAAIQAVQAPGSYEMEVETSTKVSDRTLAVLGLYRLDIRNDSYASLATTTLTIPEEPAASRNHSFTLENVSIGNDVYLRIDTESPLLRKTIPHSKEWRSFKGDAIPQEFKDIAVHGPVLNNLMLFSGGGKYIRLIEKPQEITIDDTVVSLYRFELSPAAVEVEGGTLRSLLNRIGNGTVDVWLDESQSIRVVTIHGDNYVSTSTVLGVNIPVAVERPSIGE